MTSTSDSDAIRRFSSRAHYYKDSRPGYPAAIIETLTARCGLSRNSVVADIGSGTGLLSKLFLDNGNRLLGVEPNPEMRKAAEERLGSYARYKSVAGQAEATTLPERSIDLIVAGQAFHWFDYSLARAEFTRVLHPHGWTALIWNQLDIQATPFASSYADLLRRFAVDRAVLDHRDRDRDAASALFSSGGFSRESFIHTGYLDYRTLEARVRSFSFSPESGDPGYQGMFVELAQLFEAHQVNKRVQLPYTATIYYGHLGKRSAVGAD